MTRKIFIILGKVIAGLLGAWIALLLLLEVCLSPTVMSKIVRKVASEYVDGTLEFTKARASIFKRFPSLYVDIEDFCLTYPADRFDQLERQGAQGWLLHHGCGETSDTLASFKSFKASVRMIPLLRGHINVPYLNLDKPRIFAHSYDAENANWNMFRLSGGEEDSDSTSKIPPVSLGKISLSSQPHIVYTDSRDTLFAMLRLKSFDFKGRIANRKVSHNRIGLEIDSLIVAGRLGKDTITFGMQTMKIDENGKTMDINVNARTFLATKSLGRLDVPIKLDAGVSFPEDSVFAVSVERFDANIATIPISLSGHLRFMDESLHIKAEAAINRCNINGLLKGLAKNIVPDADKISTNALLTIKARCDGEYIYETGKLPEADVVIAVPQSVISHSALREDISLALDMSAEVDKRGKVNASLNKTDFSASGIGVSLAGKGKDLLGKDPKFSLKGSVAASLEELSRFLPDSLGIHASGNILAELEGDMLMSQLDIYRFSDAALKGEVQGRDLNVQMPAEQISAYIRSLDIQLGPEDQKSRRDTTISKRMLAIRGQIDSLDVEYANLKAKGRELSIIAKSSAEVLKGDKNFHHLGGRFAAQRLSVDDGAGSRLVIRETSNGFQVVPDKDNAKIPILTFTSRNKAIALKSGVQRAGLKDATVIASAKLKDVKKAPRQKRRVRNSETPEWMKEEDFRKQDIDIRLDEELARYFRQWDFRGSLKVGGGFIASPYFPLKNRLNGFKGRFNSNEINISEFRISSGKSEIHADGKLSGLRRMLTGRKNGMLNLDLNINSDSLDANELLKAYNAGAKFDEKTQKKHLEHISDNDYQDAIAADTAAVGGEIQMETLVVPGNINAKVKLNVNNLRYTGLQVDSLTATAIMKERCVQITDTELKSNVGDIGFEGFYASRSKQDLKAGFSVDFRDITAEKVIALMPAIDTLMPPLKSFEGLLNCEIAGTAQLDTNMNIVMPSINGILRITGDNLAVKNNAAFRKLARKLLFKNKKEGHIEHMSVEGVISDNVVEVFPFVLKMDRYTLALSGIQNLDMSFKYHVSLIKSPFLIRLGVDMYGPDFDNMKFKIGRAKYRNPDVPVFTKVIDNTKVNLVKSIENIFVKGAEAAIEENSDMPLLKKFIKDNKYIRAVDQEMEPLSEEEQKKVAEEEAAQAAEEAAIESRDSLSATVVPQPAQIVVQ